MRKNLLFSGASCVLRSKIFKVGLLCYSLLCYKNVQSQNTIYYSGSSADIPHYRIVENTGGTASLTAAGTGIKITSTASDSYYTLAQRMNDASRSFINVSDLFPTNDTSGVVSFKIVDQPAPGKLIVRLGLYSVNNDCSITSMPIEYSGKDAEYSTTYSGAHQVEGTTYTVNLSSNEMRTQFNAAYLLAVSNYGPYVERPEGFVLKIGWASYTGAQSYITIDNISYVAPTNINVTPASCFNTTTILPVSLKNFEAKPLAGSVALSWVTAVEQGSSSFIIERSTDAKNFSAIGSVASNGTSITTKQYSFDDINPVSGTSWYRLRIKDKDGSSKYSDVRSVFYSTGRRQTVLVQNNSGVQSLDLSGWNLQQAATLSLADVSGRIISTIKAMIDSRVIHLADNIPSGVYLLRLQQDGRQVTTKVVF